MRILLLIIGLLLSCLELTAQEPGWLIRGVVLDEDGNTLPGVTLQAADQQQISDADGRFVFQLSTLSEWLSARCIGYFPQRIQLNTLTYRRNTTQLTIYLKSNAVNLPEVAITTKPMESVYQEDFRSNLLDYAFAGPDLLLLVQEKKQTILRLTDDNGRTKSELQLPGRADFLHTSCTGNLHVVGGQWAWEITLARDNRIDTFPRYTSAVFHHLVEPCVLEQQGYYFFRKTGAYRQSVVYYYYDPQGRQHTLVRVRDEEAETQLLRRHREILYSYMKTIPDIDRDDILNGFSDLSDPNLVLNPENLTRMAETNELIAAIGFFNTLASDSVYAPLIQTGARIFLLDHVNDQLLSCVPGSPPVRIADLQYHQTPGWRKEVLVDAALERTYGRFKSAGGDLVLKEVDLNTGGVRKTYRPHIMPYLSDHFRIRNGILYFIGQPDVNIPNRRLYKLNLFTFAE